MNTAAAGALGKMLISLSKKENITAINIGRKSLHVETLKKLGAKVVLDLTHKDFEKRYEDACKQYAPKTILEAVGGSFSNTLLQAQDNAHLIAYASLSQEDISINPQTIIRPGKVIEGFHLGTWLAKQPLHKKVLLTRKAQKLISQGVLSTRIHQTFELAKINEAIADYQKYMSPGKWVLTP